MSNNATKIKKVAAKTPSKSWKKRCEESGSSMMMMPAELVEKAKSFKEEEKNMVKAAREFDAVAEDFKHSNEEFWYNFRKHFRDSDTELPEGCRIGFNEEAYGEGELVVNFIPKTAGEN